MYSGRQRFSQIHSVKSEGGMSDRLPMPYGEFGSISPDGNKIAYTPKSRSFRTWKRYRGGMAADIWIFDLKNNSAKRVTDNDFNDEIPMWHGNTIYFLSDRGSEKRMNIWAYNTESEEFRQLTNFSDFDIHFPSIGPDELVFEAGGKLYLLNLETEKYEEVQVEVVTDKSNLKPHMENVGSSVTNAWISPKGKRVLFEARGEIFSAPAENGVVKNLTNTPGIAERYPAWSPNGKYAAYWSDASGEYELTVIDFENGNTEEKLTSYGTGYKYQPYWSPNSKMVAFIDNHQNIKIYDVENDKTIKVDKTLWKSHGGLASFDVDWSKDSRWLTYSRGLENRHGAIFVFDVNNEEGYQLTSGYYNDSNPAFDPDGKYIYYLTNRTFSPEYSDLDNSFIYPNTTNLAVMPLRKDVESPLKPKNDEVEIDSDNEKEDDEKENGDEEDSKEEEDNSIEIDTENIENRVEIISSVDAGNYTNVEAVSGKIIYHKMPNTGSDSKAKPIKYYDLEEREEKTILDDADGYMLSADKNKMMVIKSRNFFVVDIQPSQKLDKQVSTSDLEMKVEPMKEWKQIFADAWRFERDFFYDPNMHGVDWEKMRKRYGSLIDDAVSRADVNYILGELIAELNASHTYRGGGDTESPDRENVGYLGVDWEVSDGHYRIKNIVDGAVWDVETKSPFHKAGVDVNEGDYILAVNGTLMDVDKDPYAYFQGLAGKTIELTVNDEPSEKGAQKVIVEAMGSESRLRHLAWIEQNRKRVDEATDGKVGYIYVRSTGRDGQNELVRQFNAQYQKDALIIDERFNSGGQIPDRFIELLNRKPLAFWAVRDGKNWQWPPVANFGPKVMLINGWSGSGGDAFPDFFKKRDLGPLVGTRTWGGLIGISGAPRLIDGGVVTVPTFRMYDPNGEWFPEGHGVEPDIKVVDDPAKLAEGTDPQLEKAIETIKELLKENPPLKPEQPSYETR
jgi:tricorn protease